MAARYFESGLSKIDLRRVKFDLLLEKSELKQKKARRSVVWVGILTFVPILLVYASLQGVALSVTLLGISLEGIEQIKELCLFAMMLGFGVGNTIESELIELRSLKKALIKKRYGSVPAEFLFPAFFDTFDDEWVLSHRVDGLVPSWIRQLMEVTKDLTGLFLAMGVISIVVHLQFTVSAEIWKNPTLPELAARSLVIFSWAVTLVSFTYSFVLNFQKFTYYDIAAAKKISLVDFNTKELSSEAVKIAQDVVAQNKTREQIVLAIVLFVLLSLGSYTAYVGGIDLGPLFD